MIHHSLHIMDNKNGKINRITYKVLKSCSLPSHINFNSTSAPREKPIDHFLKISLFRNSTL